MDLTETISTMPIQAERSVRRNELRCLTSGKAGKIVPLAYVPMLREDRVSRGRVRLRFEMMETVETLLNAINVTCYAHFVPFLAFERFNGLDAFNRSYKGIPETEGGTAIPFFETIAYDRAAEIFKTMGLHAKQGSLVNSAVVEAYNVLVNFRRKARSTKLPVRLKTDTTLAQAFWKNPGMRHIVPDFDAALMDGEVSVELATNVLPLKNVWGKGGFLGGANNTTTINPDGTTVATSGYYRELMGFSSAANGNQTEGFTEPFVELAGQGVNLSLANIDRAKQTAAFARLRAKYAGLDDDHIIDMLMEAIRVPDAQMAQPILLDRKSTIMGYTKRHATDGANLAKSVTTGETVVDMTMRTPPMNTGGIILITCEIVPEQLYERQQDTFLHLSTVDALPSFTRDYLDPEKVAVVKNEFVDVEHSNPDGAFGYAPLNHEWNRAMPNIGGKFQRQLNDPFIEDRQRLWAVETVDPVLTDDFYLVNDLNHSVFADTVSDAFEMTTLGAVEIVGNTVFGKGLQENTGDYDAINEDVDDGRVVQVPAGTPV